MAYTDARLFLLHRVAGGFGGTGENLHLNTAAGELTGCLQDENVHASGVTGPRLREGRGVHGEKRHTA